MQHDSHFTTHDAKFINLIFIIFKRSKSAVTDLKSSQNSKILSTTLFLEKKAEIYPGQPDVHREDRK